MMTITIQHDNEEPHVYKNVVGVDFIDKENCENVAGRELSNSELGKIERVIGNLEYFPTETELIQIIEDLED